VVDGPLTASEIRTRMQGIRRDLNLDMHGVVSNATDMFDWKNYVRTFPWTSLAVAGVVGYFLIPRRSKVVTLDKSAIDALLQEHRSTAVFTSPNAAPRQPPQAAPGMARELFQLAKGVAIRVGMSYATRYGTQILSSLLDSATQASSPATPEKEHPTDSPFAHASRFGGFGRP